MSSIQPTPSNDYTWLRETRLDPETLNGVFGSIASRLKAQEAKVADYEGAVNRLTELGLTVISQNLGPSLTIAREELVALQEAAAQLVDEIAFIRNGGVDAANVTLAPIDGLVATRVQGAISELLDKIRIAERSAADLGEAISTALSLVNARIDAIDRRIGTVDERIDNLQLFPLGSLMSSLTNPGAGWLPCDGANYLQSAYADLYAVVGKIKDRVHGPALTAHVGAYVTKAWVGAPGEGLIYCHIANTYSLRRTVDGLAWTSYDIPRPHQLSHLVYGGGKYLLVYSEYVSGTSSYTVRALVSTALEDIVNITPVVVSTENGVAAAVSFSSAGFILSISGRIYSSVDGATWSLRASNSNSIVSLASNGIRTIGVGQVSGTPLILRSDDGFVTSTAVTIPAGTGVFNFVIHDGSRWIAASTNRIIASVDGMTWITLANLGATEVACLDGAYAYRNGTSAVYVTTDNFATTATPITVGTTSLVSIANAFQGFENGATRSFRIPLYSYDPTTEFAVPLVALPMTGKNAEVKTADTWIRVVK